MCRERATYCGCSSDTYYQCYAHLIFAVKRREYLIHKLNSETM
jgi:hypothetical protein